jgi:glyoxylase-like metal-dependent hydrolase (beta-lactamase superfamily II)
VAQPPAVFDVAPGITAIDTFMGGRERYTAAYLLEGRSPTLIETGPTTSVEPVVAALTSLGVAPDGLAHIVLTHIHLDHAGGIGGLAARFPSATIHVHERGARHLADPTRLVASATRVYGQDRMDRLFGPVEPVPAERLRALTHGDTVDVGGRVLGVLETPGHASHHVAVVDDASGTVFTGDALGIHVPDLPVLRPATPPPDFDLDLAVRSIHAIRDLRPTALLFAHFGPIREPERTCELAERRLRDWCAAVGAALDETDDLDAIVERLGAHVAGEITTGAEAQLDLDRLETLSSIRMNAAGIVRYLTRLRERPADAGQADQPS